MIAARRWLAELVASRDRPGAAYPALDFAAVYGLDVAGTWLDEAWRVRGTPDLAFVLAALEPAVAPAHLVLADLKLRTDDAHAEPRPDLRAALPADVAAAYARVLDTLIDHFDRDSEYYATKRGFAYSVELAAPLFTGDARLAFARGALAYGSGVAGVLADDEIAEHVYNHERALTAAQLVALPCPELVTSLALGRPSVEAIAKLARCTDLTSLRIEGDVAGRIAGLPIADLALWYISTVPAWLADLPALRTLALYNSDDALDVPAHLGDVAGVTTLKLSGIRTLPPDLGRLANLRELSIEGRRLARIPAEIGRLALTKLRVQHVSRLAAVPDELAHITTLADLELGHLDTPEIPRVLFAMRWLRSLYVIGARRWPKSEEEALARALPETRVAIGYSGLAR